MKTLPGPELPALPKYGMIVALNWVDPSFVGHFLPSGHDVFAATSGSSEWSLKFRASMLPSVMGWFDRHEPWIRLGLQATAVRAKEIELVAFGLALEA